MFPLNVAAGALGGAGYPTFKASKVSGGKKKTTNKQKTNHQISHFKALYDLEKW